MEAVIKKTKAVRVAMVQLEVAYLDPDANRRKMVGFVEEVFSQEGADLVVFPELANTGYVKGREKEFGRQYWECAESIPGPTTKALGATAKKHGVYIIVGLNQRHPVIPGTLYNSGVFIGRDGEIIGVQNKLHIPGQEKHFFVPGNSIDVYQREIGSIGMLICGDLFLFPEASRVLALKGAEIICVPVNAPYRPGTIPTSSLEHTVSIRASENKLFVAACNRVGTENELNFFGRSAIAGPSSETVALGKEFEESIVRAELQMDRIIEERAFFSVFRDRRPELYSKITEAL